MATVRDNAHACQAVPGAEGHLADRPVRGSWSGSTSPRPSTWSTSGTPTPGSWCPRSPSRTPPGASPQLWARIQQAQRATGCREVVCGLEPTGTYHQAVATFLEAQGADVVLLSSSVAYWNRRTQDGTWDKHDRKDAANCADLLEQGKVLFYSQPDGPARRAPAPGAVSPPGPDRTGGLQGPLADHPPAGPGADGGAAAATALGGAARRPPGLGAGGPRAAGGAEGPAPARAGHGLCRSRGAGHRRAGPDRGARGGAARRWPSGSRPTRSSGRSRGSGPRWARSSWPRSATSAWFTQFSQLRKLAGLDIVRVQSGQFAGQARISKCGRGPPPLGALSRGDGAGADGGGPGPARGLEGQAAGRSLRRLQGDRGVGGEAAPGGLGGVAERDPVRPARARAGSSGQPR